MSSGSRVPGQDGPVQGAAPVAIGEAELDSLLERRSPMSRLMREAADGEEDPPPAVDAAIRAAARRAVSAGPQALAGTPQDGAASTGSKASAGRPWWQAARVPMAAAAMLVMTVSVTLLVDREQQALEQAANGPASAPAPAAGRETSSTPARQAPADGPQARAEVPDRESASGRVVPRTAAPTAVATAEPAVAQSATPVPSAAPVPSVASAASATGNAAAPAGVAPAARQVAPRAAAPAPMADAASGRAAASTPPPPASPAPPATPERWIEQIMEMRRTGRLLEAEESLAAFRKAWPGYPLPPELSALP